MSVNPFSKARLAKNLLNLFAVILVLTIFAGNSFSASIDVNDVIQLANEDRLKFGLQKLRISDELTAAAYAKATEMVKHDLFDHYMPDGHTPWNFILAYGYDFAYAGENLAMGWPTSETQHNAWMNSPTHRENILKPEFQEIGVAVLDTALEGHKTTLVVQMFGLTQADYVKQIDPLTNYLAILLGFNF